MERTEIETGRKRRQKSGLQIKTKKSAQNIIVKRNFVSRTLETVPKNMKENVEPFKTIFCIYKRRICSL